MTHTAKAECPRCGPVRATPMASKFPFEQRLWVCKRCGELLSAGFVDVAAFKLAKYCYSPRKPRDRLLQRLAKAVESAGVVVTPEMAKAAPGDPLDRLRAVLAKARLSHPNHSVH